MNTGTSKPTGGSAAQPGPTIGRRRPNWPRICAPAIIAALALGYLLESRGFAEPSSAEAPTLWGVAALALSALLILGTATSKSSGRRADGGHGGGEGSRDELMRAGQIILMLVGFVGLIFAVGFYVAIAAFLVLFLKFVSKLSIAASIGLALAAAGLVWLLLALLLKMDVYSGYLGMRLG